MINTFSSLLIVLGSVALLWAVSKLFLYLVRTPVLEGHFLPQLRICYQIFQPYQIVPLPSDYWLDRLYIPIDATASDREYEATFQHRYIGKYVIRLSVEKPVPTHMPKYDIGAHFTVRFSVDGKVVSTFELGDELLLGIGVGGHFGLLVYDVPKDLPRGVPIHCKVTVHLRNKSLATHYGNAVLSIRKCDDL